MSTKPLTNSAASESGSDFERPKTIVEIPKMATTASSPADELKRLIRLARRAAEQISAGLRGDERAPALKELL